MNPFFWRIQHLISVGDVIVAYSNPPGSTPIFFPCFINCFTFELEAEPTPQIFSNAPKKGIFKAKLEDRTTIFEKWAFPGKLFDPRIPIPYTLWGWKANIHFSVGGTPPSYLISKLSKYEEGWLYLTMMSTRNWIFLRGIWRTITSNRKPMSSMSKVIKAYPASPTDAKKTSCMMVRKTTARHLYWLVFRISSISLLNKDFN